MLHLSAFHTEALHVLNMNEFEAVSSPENFADWYETTMRGFDLYHDCASDMDALIKELADVKAASYAREKARGREGAGFRKKHYWRDFIKPNLAKGYDMRVLLAVCEASVDTPGLLDWGELMTQAFAFSPLQHLFADRELFYEFQDWIHQVEPQTPSQIIKKLRELGMDWEMNTTTAKKIARKFGATTS